MPFEMPKMELPSFEMPEMPEMDVSWVGCCGDPRDTKREVSSSNVQTAAPPRRGLDVPTALAPSPRQTEWATHEVFCFLARS